MDDFIHRVEDRSSLLMVTGHDIDNGRLVECFEFRHLTFQEYLTARGIVEGWYPNRQEDDRVVAVFEPYLSDDKWSEVIPLAAALGGKSAEALVTRLTNAALSLSAGLPLQTAQKRHDYLPVVTLGRCLADEVALRPPTVHAAVSALFHIRALRDGDWPSALATGRYGADFLQAAERTFMGEPDHPGALLALSTAVWKRKVALDSAMDLRSRLGACHLLLSGDDVLDRCEGAIGFSRLCFEMQRTKNDLHELRPLPAHILPMLYSDVVQEQVCAAWAFVWYGACRLSIPSSDPDVLARLYFLWRFGKSTELRRFAAWALTTQPLGSREETRLSSVNPDDVAALLNVEGGRREDMLAPLIVAWYLRVLTDAEIGERIRSSRWSKDSGHSDILPDLLSIIGEPVGRRGRGSKRKPSRHTLRSG